MKKTLPASMLAGLIGYGLLALACRGLVGIEDLEVVDGGDVGDGRVAAETSTGDASSDTSTTSPDTGTKPVDAGAAAACLASSDCRKCCKDSFAEFRDWSGSAGPRSCICTGAKGCQPCMNEDGGFCAGQQEPQGGNCVPCVDDTLIRGDCNEGCTSAACLEGLACLKACPSP